MYTNKNIEELDEKIMMNDEYGKDFSGCAWAAVISAVIIIVAAIVILFT